jgi:hypothetical protein
MIRIILILFLFLTELVVFPQRLSIRAGVNSSNLGEFDKKNNYTHQNLLGAEGGLLYEIPLAKEKNSFFVEIGSKVSAKRSRNKYTLTIREPKEGGNGYSYQVQIVSDNDLYYLSFPLNFKASATEGNIKLFCTAGTYFAVKVGEKSDYTQVTNSYEFTYEDDDYFKNTDIGLAAGLGLEFRSFTLSFMYERGIKNVYLSAYNLSKNYISSCCLSFGYSFSL